MKAKSVFFALKALLSLAPALIDVISQVKDLTTDEDELEDAKRKLRPQDDTNKVANKVAPVVDKLVDHIGRRAKRRRG